MPTISQFYGIKIILNPRDHNPPHFHVRYAEFEAAIRIADGQILAGFLPPKARGLTEEWRLIHQERLLESWDSMINFGKVIKIAGLDQ
ncbi:MAG: hypothetical protein COW00_17775 [Bdellovibrio sp. CG12_big_fil_rev_8_21_14_0_65_39_13]|nr:MAG: hypothetical protein COW78_06395 [Bdellovibrio sp. CG22_combo_CG10-13_8_21_14_all_39_27]PIQ57960.1 MAG: hypothetical protein COW00_17775 [Bdellovibrio sp. CG12_big_fil_rev_8_21_14_0_65_39_13]PIR32905.1 MAG: hypothetical protein COV37_17565 [Bdellovibrio sp. CG11_big_fil_rev_8_21_14_0_20_39_38]